MRVWKPRMTACDAEASATSDSVIVPTALWMTSSETLSDSIFLRASTMASTEPWVSALTTTLSTLLCVGVERGEQVLQRDLGAAAS